MLVHILDVGIGKKTVFCSFIGVKCPQGYSIQVTPRFYKNNVTGLVVGHVDPLFAASSLFIHLLQQRKNFSC